MVPHTWYQVLGTTYLVPSTWYQVPFYQVIAFEEVGLTLNASKCNIQTNAHTTRTPTFLEVDGMRFPIVPPWEGFKVLGVQFTLLNGVAAELDARIA